MYYTNAKQNKIIELISKFGCMRYRHIKKMISVRDLDKQLEILVSTQKIQRIAKDIYALKAIKEINMSMLKAIDVFIHLNDCNVEVDWFFAEDYPFTLAFCKKGNAFDIADIKVSNENSIVEAINRSKAEKVIAIVEDVAQMERVQIEKMVRFAIIKNDEVLFLKK